MIEEILAEAGEKMEKTIEATKTEFAKVRTGRVNPAIFSGLTAEYYGAPTPLQQLVSFNVEDARTVKIVPFDVTALAAIEKALRDSDLGVNPSNDGVAIRVVMPEMTAERRKEYTKLVNHKAEEARISIRNVAAPLRPLLTSWSRTAKSVRTKVHALRRNWTHRPRSTSTRSTHCTSTRKLNCSRSKS